ncbi:MAG: DUF2835 family protein [Gammaproteobacteria bacterium]|nr:DUF2835 family protein [Gammaproteobacteria bacterium]
MATTTVRFRLNIPREQAMRYYNGTVRFVIVHAENGQRIQFPAQHIRPFITQSGVQGIFSISFDDHHKMIGVERV